ncbi:MAG: hypothetical protein CMO55_05720 [Verrucomicrobiales bacterium]|nr:hypothetical protein [Verrucomicrobiales bacterium]
MKITAAFAVAVSLVFSAGSLRADENHEIIEKVMKEGLKGDDCPLAKVLDGKATEEETKDLNELIKTMEGTKAPVGDQDAYDEKVAELIAAMDAIAGGDTSTPALDRLDEASNCKACHKDHKPKKD